MQREFFRGVWKKSSLQHDTLCMNCTTVSLLAENEIERVYSSSGVELCGAEEVPISPRSGFFRCCHSTVYDVHFPLT
ncbi:hypothetical protein [Methanosarcina siciliae]|uniref:hypothetical protein n=1 Tax=Methanosarcina siciliae TaxID=38027 RepID=UPI000A4B5F69|nr:hypothetical protein [Methanosarcina siciliae]